MLLTWVSCGKLWCDENGLLKPHLKIHPPCSYSLFHTGNMSMENLLKNMNLLGAERWLHHPLKPHDTDSQTEREYWCGWEWHQCVFDNDASCYLRCPSEVVITTKSCRQFNVFCAFKDNNNNFSFLFISADQNVARLPVSLPIILGVFMPSSR